MFSIALVLSVLTLFTSNACAQPALYRTATSFTVKAEREIDVRVTFNPDGSLYKLESCYSKDVSKNDCVTVPFEAFKDPRELFTCVPLENEEKPEGTRVILKTYTGKDKAYDCQYVTAIEATDQVMLKAGDNTSCPFFYNGRWHDPCKR